MKRVVTLKTIAQELGLSLSAVSKALNNYPDINEETRKIVVNKALEMGYTPNLIARSLVKSTSNNIGVIVRDINTVYGELFKPLTAAARRLGLNLIVADSSRDPDIEMDYIRMMIESRVMGIIIAPVNGDFKRIDDFVFSRVPIVYLGNYVTDEGQNYVATDAVKGARLAMEYLYERGHRDIALISDIRETNSTKAKIAVYRSFMSEHRLAPALFVDDSGARTLIEAGACQAHRMLGRERSFSAAFVVKDLVAVGVMKALRDAQVSVPGDISIIGYDGSEVSANPMVDLTTVAPPKEEIAEHLIRILLTQARADERGSRLHHLAVPYVLERSSCRSLV